MRKITEDVHDSHLAGFQPNQNSTNNAGKTSLFYVQSAKEIQALLSLGADVHAVDDQGRTCLFQDHSPEALKILVAHGADVFATDYSGNTALLWGLKRSHTAGHCLALIDLGADINAVNMDKESPLHVAKDMQCVTHLIKHGAMSTLQDSVGNTPLHLSFIVKTPEHARALLDAGANVNARNRHGNTPLHFQLFHDLLFTSTLLAYGADPNAQNVAGNTPLHGTTQTKEKLMATLEVLMRYDVDLTLTNQNGDRPIFAIAPDLVQLIQCYNDKRALKIAVLPQENPKAAKLSKF